MGEKPCNIWVSWPILTVSILKILQLATVYINNKQIYVFSTAFKLLRDFTEKYYAWDEPTKVQNGKYLILNLSIIIITLIWFNLRNCCYFHVEFNETLLSTLFHTIPKPDRIFAVLLVFLKMFRSSDFYLLYFYRYRYILFKPHLLKLKSSPSNVYPKNPLIVLQISEKKIWISSSEMKILAFQFFMIQTKFEL